MVCAAFFFLATRTLCYFAVIFFFFNDTATTEIYTLSLHDALPISANTRPRRCAIRFTARATRAPRSEEHTSELQSRRELVCRLLLEKKKKKKYEIKIENKTKQHQTHKHYLI